MNSSSKNTFEFCLQFVKINFEDVSQRTQCRTWIKTAINTISNEDIGAKDFIISELSSIDGYLSGADNKMTSVDVLTKVDTVTQLLG